MLQLNTVLHVTVAVPFKFLYFIHFPLLRCKTRENSGVSRSSDTHKGSLFLKISSTMSNNSSTNSAWFGNRLFCRLPVQRNGECCLFPLKRALQ